MIKRKELSFLVPDRVHLYTHRMKIVAPSHKSSDYGAYREALWKKWEIKVLNCKDMHLGHWDTRLVLHDHDQEAK